MTGHGFEIEQFEEIGSTNTYLMERAREGAPGRLVAVADFQSAGRGRLDRRWEAPARSALLVSILLRLHLAPEELHLATAAVALAGAAAAAATCGSRPGLKWPNDLVFSEGKVAGILAEADPTAAGGARGTTAVVVGMGMNLTWPGPPGAGGTSLRDVSGVSVDRDHLLDEVLNQLASRLSQLDVPTERPLLLQELEESLVTIGQEVTVDLGSRRIEGVAVGLSPAGHLVVDVAGETVEVAAGDVVHLRPSAPRGHD